MGVNVNHERFPAELVSLATSLRIEAGSVHSRLALLVKLLRQLEGYYNRLLAGGSGPLLEEFQRVSSFARGKRVRVRAGAESFTGTTDGLDPNGMLRVQRDEGGVELVIAGEVTEAS
jgi:BirA family biotin operon repressor/biotin-[acetyl-CoA-carboxylase] ligase